MNMSNAILRERPTRKQKISASSIKVKAAHPPNLRLRRALRVASIVIAIAFLTFSCSAVLGANPAEEMAKAGATGGGGSEGGFGGAVGEKHRAVRASFVYPSTLSQSYSGGWLCVRDRVAPASRITQGSAEGL